MVRGSLSKARHARLQASSAVDLPNVILVDDDSLLRAALGRLLRGAGFKVTAFEHPSDVLLSLLPKSNTCLILDIYMPEMTGVKLWHELRARGFDVPTILITGQRDEQSRLYGEQIGAVAVLYKPLEEKELFETIERALGRPVSGS
jgi:FixJ family two-component response regulator